MDVRERKIKTIITYLEKQVSQGNYPSYREIDQKFCTHSYGIKLTDLYPKIGISNLELKCKRPNGSFKTLRENLVKYVQEETKRGHFPTRRFIEKTFRIRLTELFGGISDLYKQAGINYRQSNSQFIKRRKAELLQEIVREILPKIGLTVEKERSTHERGG